MTDPRMGGKKTETHMFIQGYEFDAVINAEEAQLADLQASLDEATRAYNDVLHYAQTAEIPRFFVAAAKTEYLDAQRRLDRARLEHGS